MKYLYFLSLVIPVLMVSCVKSEDGFHIDAEIKDLEEGVAILQKRYNSEFITIDSAIIKNNTFSFSGSIENPEMCYIYFNDTLPYLRLFVENTSITIESHLDSLRNPDISGSELNDALADYNALMQPFDEELRSIYQSYSSAKMADDTSDINQFEAAFDSVAEQQKVASLDFVSRNSDNVLGPYLTWGTLAYDLTIEELENLAGNFSPEISGSVYVKQINDYVATLKKVDIGQPFTDISLPDSSGEIKKLSDLKGKIILIDFWASWCGPCRRENPKVVAMYNDFKNENFEIFGVSFDESKEKWLQAIQEDNLTWEHVSDLKGWNSKAGKLYGVRSIPHTVLIDENGIIVDKNLRGENLRKRVKELIQG